jgi:hypothetical protein
MADFTDFSITLTRGDTRRFRFTVKDPSTGALADITTWQKFWVTARYNTWDSNAAPVFVLTSDSQGLALIDPVNGLVEGTLSPTHTAGLTSQEWILYGDIQGKDGAGNIWTISRGHFIVLPDVTFVTS